MLTFMLAIAGCVPNNGEPVHLRNYHAFIAGGEEFDIAIPGGSPYRATGCWYYDEEGNLNLDGDGTETCTDVTDYFFVVDGNLQFSAENGREGSFSNVLNGGFNADVYWSE